MKKLYFIFFLLFPLLVNAQDSTNYISAKNTIYAEAYGNTYIYSVNYERVLWQPKYFKVGLRIGIGVLPNQDYYNLEKYHWNKVNFSLPAELNLMIGRKSNYVDVGIGYCYDYSHGYQDSEPQDFPSIGIGWNDSIDIANGIAPNEPIVRISPPPPVAIWDVHRLTYRISYRRQKPQGGWFWRVGIGNSYFLSDKRFYRNSKTMVMLAFGGGMSF